MLTVLIFLLVPSLTAERATGPAAGSVGVDESGVWENRKHLDPGGVLTLCWNGTNRENGSFTLLLEGLTHGYVGLGLSPLTGTMAGADMVVAWVDAIGVAHVRDYWAAQNGSPTLDALQDWRILWSRENNTHTSILMTRALVTGHQTDIPITPGALRLIYSWSESDPDGIPHYHGKDQRGVKTLELLPKSTANQRIVSTTLITLLLPSLIHRHFHQT